MLSGFPISPGSGSSEAATTKAEVGVVLKSKEMMGTSTPVYYTTKKDFKSFVCWMSVFFEKAELNSCGSAQKISDSHYETAASLETANP